MSAEVSGAEKDGEAWGWGEGGSRESLLGRSLCNPSPPLHSFLTKRGQQVCAKPREAWVQEHVTDLELNACMARKLQGRCNLSG